MTNTSDLILGALDQLFSFSKLKESTDVKSGVGGWVREI